MAVSLAYTEDLLDAVVEFPVDVACDDFARLDHYAGLGLEPGMTCRFRCGGKFSGHSCGLLKQLRTFKLLVKNVAPDERASDNASRTSDFLYRRLRKLCKISGRNTFR